MRIKPFMTLIYVALILATALRVAESAEELSKEEILALLPRGVDMDDHNHVARYMRLVALGPSVHAVLGEDLLRVEEFEPAGRIIAIFEESTGDKAVAMKYLERFLDLPRTGSAWPSVRAQASQTLSKLRDEQSSSVAKGVATEAPGLQNPSPTTTLDPKPEAAIPTSTPPASPAPTEPSSERHRARH